MSDHLLWGVISYSLITSCEVYFHRLWSPHVKFLVCFIVFIRFKAAYFLCDFLLLFFYYVMIWRLIFYVSRFMSVYLIKNSWKVSEKLLFTFVLLVCLFFSCLYSSREYFSYTCMVTSPLPLKGCKNVGLCSKATAFEQGVSSPCHICCGTGPPF